MNALRALNRAVLVLLSVATAGHSIATAQQMSHEEEPEETGFTEVRSDPFPLPRGIVPVPIANAGFENANPSAQGLSTTRLDRTEATGAPEGRAILQASAQTPGQLTLDLPVTESRPYMLSLWLRSTARGAGTAASTTTTVHFGKVTPLGLPNTGGTWKRVGLFFRTTPGATAVRVVLRLPSASAVDELQFREATEAEFSSAYANWRVRYPKRDLTPRSNDGRHLAHFVSKLSKPETAGRSLRIMGIGSSYTNMLGTGETLIQNIRERFPHAPPIIYTKHVGSAAEFDFTRGWMRQHVLGARPDLVILYSGGKAADLESLLADFRAHSSADIIVASLHLRAADKEINEQSVNAPEWDAIRAVALKYNCEWVENRREWAAYLQEHHQPLSWLLKDPVHQNDHGALVVNENICRHFVAHQGAANEPKRERRLLPGGKADGPREGERAAWDSSWRVLPSGHAESKAAGATVRVRFYGNRIDLVGTKVSDGGSLRVRIDGAPAAEAQVFQTTLIVPGTQNHKPERGLAADRAPHLVQLGDASKIVPQRWTLRMTSDTGDYELIGSITGVAGQGNNGRDVYIENAEITVPTALWRRRLEPDGRHSNRTGDTFGWDVVRATTPKVDFRSTSWPAKDPLHVTVADNLVGGWHEVEFTTESDAAVTIGAFLVHEPALVRPRG
ncbi:MAG: hypothetical protein RLZZ162_426 [Verrucomicrobiota bacterium]|jgi:hypothetical protein